MQFIIFSGQVDCRLRSQLRPIRSTAKGQSNSFVAFFNFKRDVVGGLDPGTCFPWVKDSLGTKTFKFECDGWRFGAETCGSAIFEMACADDSYARVLKIVRLMTAIFADENRLLELPVSVENNALIKLLATIRPA